MIRTSNSVVLPVPQSERYVDGVFAPNTPVTITIPAEADDRLIRSLERFARALPFPANVAAPTRDTDTTIIRAILDPSIVGAERYRLRINERSVHLGASSPTGIFHGCRTLLRIAAIEGRVWACRIIDDAPDLPVRGVSLDVSRGKIPTLETLKRIVDRFADVKINHLQLYVEHTFDFQFDPAIAAGCSALTRDDITQLDAYCRDRFIDLVPTLACFGHMGRILSLPRYRTLAEIPCAQSWEEQPWLQRLRGLTINPRDSAARRLIETMLDEFLPLFSSRFANVCADETHDLGRGVNREHCDRVGKGELYVDHLKFLGEVCARHDRRMMLWGDVLRSFPERMRELPENAVLSDWGYERDATFPAVASPHRGSRDVYVCPGTSGWNRVINALSIAEANIDKALTSAHEHAAAGLVITDWGDQGHFNMLACSMPAIIRAASEAWNRRAVGQPAFDRAIESHLFGVRSNGLLSALRDVGRLGESVHTWLALFGDDDHQLGVAAEGPGYRVNAASIDPRTAEEHERTVDQALRLLDPVEASPDKTEWWLACRASALLARKARWMHERAVSPDGSDGRWRRLADDVADFSADYAAAWRATNRPDRLQDVLDALNAGFACAPRVNS